MQIFNFFYTYANFFPTFLNFFQILSQNRSKSPNFPLPPLNKFNAPSPPKESHLPTL